MRFSLITVAAAACMLAAFVQAAPVGPQDAAGTTTTTTQQEGQQKPATGVDAIDAVSNGGQGSALKAATELGDINSLRKIRGKSDQDRNGLTPAQQFCAYQSVSGSAGLHRLQHKVQNGILGGSLECTLVKAAGV
ncbi:hypothetical protein BDB00DRAFT_788626 [Zychaea mexicana]|uniref:uncharacterized protein n=1 Tax=Zychaea mexicana TaxID=64656 RepID=UPI0022FF2CB9|nr:uncharacterized protein BDB00DRAFT_788626 [Zychaea mexicana]KAI9492639.1 hypothetical protein BDB00DRAFT_788626 [Zychaea mexicana]